MKSLFGYFSSSSGYCYIKISCFFSSCFSKLSVLIYSWIWIPDATVSVIIIIISPRKFDFQFSFPLKKCLCLSLEFTLKMFELSFPVSECSTNVRFYVQTISGRFLHHFESETAYTIPDRFPYGYENLPDIV